MIYKEIPIQVEGSDKTSRAQFYILDTLPDEMKIQKRPIILICPGGGYHKVSYREGEPLAMHFLSLGYHACVLQYSVSPEAFYPTQLLEVTESVRQIHEHAKNGILTQRKLYWRELQQEDIWRLITVHFRKRDVFRRRKVGMQREMLKPRGLILCYPVITSDPKYAHTPSFQNLLGDTVEEEAWNLSLDHQITDSMPPCFIWHTATDQTVPLPNSLLLAMALWKAGIPVELHVYPEGIHGLSLANELVECLDGRGVQEECTSWISLVDTWLDRLMKKEGEE
mgnify:CR=1 FL=1